MLGKASRRRDSPNLAQFSGMALEGVLASLRDECYASESAPSLLRELRRAISIIGRNLVTRRRPTDSEARVLHLPSNDQEHCRLIAKSVVDDGVDGVRVVGWSGEQGVDHLSIASNATFSDVLHSLTFVLFGWADIRSCLTGLPPSVLRGAATRMAAWSQLVLGLSIQRFMSAQAQLVCVTADFDRGPITGPWFAAAASRSISSASIQHGVILPSGVRSGFSPLVADLIGVWGVPAQEQLISEGVDPDRTCIVGNSARALHVLPDAFGAMNPRESDRPDVPKVVVLALSGWDETKNRSVVARLSSLKSQYSEADIRFAVRLHPAHPRERFAWVEQDFGIEVQDQSYSLEDFVRSTDVLLVADSTFGIVGLANGIPTGVALPLDDNLKSDADFFEYLSVPTVGSYDDLQCLLAGKQTIDVHRVRSVVGDPVDGRINEMVTNLLKRRMISHHNPAAKTVDAPHFRRRRRIDAAHVK